MNKNSPVQDSDVNIEQNADGEQGLSASFAEDQALQMGAVRPRLARRGSGGSLKIPAPFIAGVLVILGIAAAAIAGNSGRADRNTTPDSPDGNGSAVSMALPIDVDGSVRENYAGGAVGYKIAPNNPDYGNRPDKKGRQKPGEYANRIETGTSLLQPYYDFVVGKHLASPDKYANKMFIINSYIPEGNKNMVRMGEDEGLEDIRQNLEDIFLGSVMGQRQITEEDLKSLKIPDGSGFALFYGLIQQERNGGFPQEATIDPILVKWLRENDVSLYFLIGTERIMINPPKAFLSDWSHPQVRIIPMNSDGSVTYSMPYIEYKVGISGNAAFGLLSNKAVRIKDGGLYLEEDTDAIQQFMEEHYLLLNSSPNSNYQLIY